MKAHSSKISERVKATRFLVMEMYIKAATYKANHTVKELISGPMVRYLMASGTKASNVATVSGEDKNKTRILGSGRMGKRKAMACIHGPTAINTKVSGTKT